MQPVQLVLLHRQTDLAFLYLVVLLLDVCDFSRLSLLELTLGLLDEAIVFHHVVTRLLDFFSKDFLLVFLVLDLLFFVIKQVIQLMILNNGSPQPLV